MSSSTLDYDTQLRILLLGESGAGKTSLLLRFTDDLFEERTVSTVGVDFRVKRITLQWRRVRLQIWDTNGQERFRSITRSYYRGAQGVVLVFDAGDRRSFENVMRWVQDIKQHATEREVMVMLVANKVDIPAERRVITPEMGAQLAAEIGSDGVGCPYFETSARTGHGVEEAFTSIAEHIVFGRPRPARRALLAVRQRLLWAGFATGCLGSVATSPLEASAPTKKLPLRIVETVAHLLADSRSNTVQAQAGALPWMARLDNVLRRHDQAKGSRPLDSRWTTAELSSNPASRVGSPRAASKRTGSVCGATVDVGQALAERESEQNDCC
eukprot:SAG31_NODE_402_length_16197_cov_5.262425_4_plen_327_part_00